MFTFFIFDWQYSFWANLVQKVKIVSLRSILILTLIRKYSIEWWCLLFSFSNGNTLFRKFGPKNRNCQLKAKLGTYTNSNMQNSMGMFIFFRLRSEIPFLSKFGPKNQNCQFKVKLDNYTNSNMENLMVMFTFFVFDRKYSFWANLVQKIKIVSLR